MALKNLSVEEMVAVSSAWVSAENPAHGLVLAQPRLAALLSDLARVHGAIYAVAPRDADPRKAEIVRLALEADAVHDAHAGAIYGALSALSALDDQGAELLILRDKLFPQGLQSTVQVSYRGQAGNAGLVRERLTPALRAQLEGVPLRRGNLLERVEAWLSAADLLGQLEEERARLEQPTSPSLGRQVTDARNGWIRVVNAFVGMVALAELDEASERVVLGPLRDAESRADQRAARRRSGTAARGGEVAESADTVLA